MVEEAQRVEEEVKKDEGGGLKPNQLSVGVQYRRAGKIYTFATTDPTLEAGDMVTVETEYGSAIGIVAVKPQEVSEGRFPKNVRKVLRRSSDDELKEEEARREKALEHFDICREMIAERDLPMKLIDAEIADNGRKVRFIFFAEQRVDFRSLVKDLATRLHMRIEMQQLGSRDEAKHIGCLGPCGLMTCCSLHLRNFQPISISMAKHQGLSPNPAKLTGMCGKLKCCIAYEHEVYEEYRKDLPKVGAAVKTPSGEGKIVSLDVLKRSCIVRLYGGKGDARCTCGECKVLSAKERDTAITEAKKAIEAERDERDRIRSRRERGRDRNGDKGGDRGKDRGSDRGRNSERRHDKKGR